MRVQLPIFGLGLFFEVELWYIYLPLGIVVLEQKQTNVETVEYKNISFNVWDGARRAVIRFASYGG